MSCPDPPRKGDARLGPRRHYQHIRSGPPSAHMAAVVWHRTVRRPRRGPEQCRVTVDPAHGSPHPRSTTCTSSNQESACATGCRPETARHRSTNAGGLWNRCTPRALTRQGPPPSPHRRTPSSCPSSPRSPPPIRTIPLVSPVDPHP